MTVNIELTDLPPLDVSIERPTVELGLERPVIEVQLLGNVFSGAGATATRYVHNQATLSDTWLVVHNLNAHPAVSIEDAGGTVLFGTVKYLSAYQLSITFAKSATGRANCI
jgi:hypothetical protein